MQTTNFDYFILGQGLAGSLLAFSLIKKGGKVCVLDNHHAHSSSAVAAGIINPITGHRLNLTEHFERDIGVANVFYRQIEQTLKNTFFHPITQQRLIKNAGQFNYFKQRLEQEAYQGYLTLCKAQGYFNNTPYHIAKINRSARLEVKKLLACIRTWLKQHNAYQALRVNYSSINITKSGITINNAKAKNIIFCEGFQATNNPYLEHLPFKLSQGDILTVALDSDYPCDTMLNWGNWLLSTQPQQARLGSNYTWNPINPNKFSCDGQVFLDKLAQHTKVNAHLIKQETGVRPTTLHRTPLVGKLTNIDNAYCFNGFGSKGCLSIPYHAEQLSNHLIHGSPITNTLTKWL